MAWTDNELTADAAGAVRAHVAQCATCQDLVAAMGSVSDRLAAWQVEPARLTRPPLRQPAPALPWVIAAAATVALVAGVSWWSRGPHATPPPDATSVSVEGGTGSPVLPTAGTEATVMVTVFMDWQCPPCLDGYPAYRRVVDDVNAGGRTRVALTFKDFPLDESCNPAVSRALHPGACVAAAAVRMARERRREPEMIDWLTSALPAQRQPDDVRRATERILGPLDFDAEVARYREAIDRDIAEAQRLHVQATPTVFVNGVAVRPGELRAAIDAALVGAAP